MGWLLVDYNTTHSESEPILNWVPWFYKSVCIYILTQKFQIIYVENHPQSLNILVNVHLEIICLLTLYLARFLVEEPWDVEGLPIYCFIDIEYKELYYAYFHDHI